MYFRLECGPGACFDYKPEEFEFNWAKNSSAETKEKVRRTWQRVRKKEDHD